MFIDSATMNANRIADVTNDVLRKRGRGGTMIRSTASSTVMQGK